MGCENIYHSIKSLAVIEKVTLKITDCDCDDNYKEKFQ